MSWFSAAPPLRRDDVIIEHDGGTFRMAHRLSPAQIDTVLAGGVINKLRRRPERRMMATIHRIDGRRRVAVKGAPEAVLEVCTGQMTADGTQELDDDARNDWLDCGNALAADGLRVLGVAEKETESSDDDAYSDLVVVGLLGMRDPPRTDVREALAEVRKAGVRVVMVTGDQARTARSIGRTLGFSDERVVEGRELPSAGDVSEDDKRRMVETEIFARVEPKQKLDLIEIFQKGNKVVAMTGDGVNDAPALRKADIGIAMGRRGTQVAREAAAMILRDDAFTTIVHAVRQGARDLPEHPMS